MKAAFAHMMKGILAAMGEDAILRSDIACCVNIEHGVQLTGEDGNLIVSKSVATIDKTLVPKAGDTLQHPDGHYKLDAVLEDNGVSMRFILIKTTP